MGPQFPEFDPALVAVEIIRKTQGEGPPFDFQKCLDFLGGVRIVPETLAGTGYLLELGEERAEILVNRRVSTSRQRFTAAHELGHLILQRLTRNQAPPQKSHSRNEAELERWCEKFAVSLLMPERWIRGWLPSLREVGNPKVLFLGPKRFGVSKEAFYLRLNDMFRVIVVERTVRDSDIQLRLFPRRWDFPEAEDVAGKVGMRRFGKQIWESASGGISGGPFLATINHHRESLVFVLRGAADSGVNVNTKLSRFAASS